MFCANSLEIVDVKAFKIFLVWGLEAIVYLIVNLIFLNLSTYILGYYQLLLGILVKGLVGVTVVLRILDIL